MHNYCNRWCERCPLGHRCAINASRNTYVDEFEQALNLLDSPLDSGEKEALEEEASESAGQEEFTDYASYFPALEEDQDFDEEFERRQTELKDRIDSHPLRELSVQAAHCVEMVCERLQALLRDRPPPETDGLSWRQVIEAEKEEQQLNNFLDVLRWYRFPLEVKTRRALSGLLDDEEDEDEVQNDWNGSAKVVKIAIQHCAGAGRKLLEMEPRLEDDLFLLLGQLQDFESALDDTFPHAAEFIRPGFDTLGIKEDLGV